MLEYSYLAYTSINSLEVCYTNLHSSYVFYET